MFAPRTQKVYAVSELNAKLRRLLEGEFTTIRVMGEVSNLSTPSSGHVYFSLKDAAASFPAVMFRNAVARMTGPFPGEGMLVECLGKLTLYEPRGRAQLVVEWMIAQGEGALGLRFLALKEKLQKEGLFDPQKKRQLPYIPGRIGIVTSPSGAAVRDILKVLDERFASIPVLLYPVQVQGEGAADQIARAIDWMGQHAEVDVLIVGRGGGSVEDLWAFNEEQVVRAVAACRVPVVSAVGHEVDLVLTDLAADVRAPTPTAAAERVVPDSRLMKKELFERGWGLKKSMDLIIAEAKNRLSVLMRRMRDPRLVVAAHRMRLDENARVLENLISTRLQTSRKHLMEARVRLARKDPRAKLALHRVAMQNHQRRLSGAVGQKIVYGRMHLEARRDAMQRLSPLEVLNRGYSIVTKQDGSVVRSFSQVSGGDIVRVRLQKGVLDARVDRAMPHPYRDQERDISKKDD